MIRPASTSRARAFRSPAGSAEMSAPMSTGAKRAVFDCSDAASGHDWPGLSPTTAPPSITTAPASAGTHRQ